MSDLKRPRCFTENVRRGKFFLSGERVGKVIKMTRASVPSQAETSETFRLRNISACSDVPKRGHPKCFDSTVPMTLRIIRDIRKLSLRQNIVRVTASATRLHLIFWTGTPWVGNDLTTFSFRLANFRPSPISCHVTISLKLRLE